MKPLCLFSAAVLLSTGAVLLRGVTAATAQAEPSPTAAVAQVQAFYRFHFAHDMGFSREGVRARATWLSPQLQQAALAYLAKPTSPDEVPDIDGDPFTNSQEFPKSFQVGAAKVSKATAVVPVTFHWRHSPARSVSVHLVAQGGTWLIDDIACRGEPSLRKLLASSDK